MPSWGWFLACTLLSIVIQGFFALFEMACVSFSKIRLQYYVSINRRRALWLNELIQKPSRLFGTTLIGINTALLIGSECARRFYEQLHLNPDLAPLTQLFLVVLFGELVPMFAARRHPEQLAMTFAPLLIFISRLLIPFIWAFDQMAKIVHRLIGRSEQEQLFLSREEVQKAFEEEEAPDDFNVLLSKVFRMKSLSARQSMTPIASLQLIASSATIGDARHQLSIRYEPFLPVYHKTPQNIVAIAHLRDLLQLDPKKKILDVARPPWFVTHDVSLLQILDQFRRNNQSIAVILDAKGQAAGVLSLNQIIDALFGEAQSYPLEVEKGGLYVERTLSGSLLIQQFNTEFLAHLPFNEPDDTLSDLLVAKLGHAPAKGESVEIESYEFTVLEPTLRGVKLLSVKTIE